MQMERTINEEHAIEKKKNTSFNNALARLSEFFKVCMQEKTNKHENSENQTSK
jgi:hypothetical protein